MKALRMLVCTLLIGGLPVGSAVWAQDITGGGSLIRFTLEGEPFSEWEFAHRDSAGMITSRNVADADGDGITSFLAGFGETGIRYQHQEFDYYFKVVNTRALSSPILGGVDGNSLIVEVLGSATAIFSLRQPVTVTDGMVAGLDGVVHNDPGIPTAADLLAIDVSSLPRFRGAAEVVGLITIQVIPEPGSTALAVLGLMGVSITRRNFFASIGGNEAVVPAP